MEMRAFNNLNWYRSSTPYSFIGLLGFGRLITYFLPHCSDYNMFYLGPNINIVRDPRFGRNSELPSEDPFLSGSYLSQLIRRKRQLGG